MGVSSVIDEGVGVGNCAGSAQSSWLEVEVVVGVNVIAEGVSDIVGAGAAQSELVGVAFEPVVRGVVATAAAVVFVVGSVVIVEGRGCFVLAL